MTWEKEDCLGHPKPERINDCAECDGMGSVPINVNHPISFDFYSASRSYIFYNAKICPVCKNQRSTING